jgi:hypothetical protein
MHIILYKGDLSNQTPPSVIATFPASNGVNTMLDRHPGFINSSSNSPVVVQTKLFHDWKDNSLYTEVPNTQSFSESGPVVSIIWSAYIQAPYFIMIKPH